MGEFQRGNEQDTEKAIDNADDAQQKWAETSPPKRAEYLFKTGVFLQSQKDELSRTVSVEMRKTLRDAMDEVQQAIDLAYYIAGGRKKTPRSHNNF